MDKFELRRHFLGARKSLSPTARRQAARAALRLALRHGLLLNARRVGFYCPQGSEFDVEPLMRRARTMRRQCYLPVLARRGRVMRFGKLARGTRMAANRYGIPEPVDARSLRARQLDLLFVPLVGFDSAGYRLGMGGGYYDATLAYARGGRRGHKPRLVGVAYECQHADILPHDPWDMPLDAVLTEQRLRRFTDAARR